jgi:hypothetical protein
VKIYYNNEYNKHAIYRYNKQMHTHGTDILMVSKIQMDMRNTGLGEFKVGERLIMIIHIVVNIAARKTFPTKLPFLFGSA